MMDINEFLNVFTVRRYINLHFDGDNCNPVKIDTLINTCIKMEPKWTILNVNLSQFGEKEDFGEWFRFKANEELCRSQFPYRLKKSDTFSELLEQLENFLTGEQTLLFLHPLIASKIPKNKKNNQFPDYQRDILKEIRKFIGMHQSLQLGLVLFSDIEVTAGELYPTSPLDDRHVTLINIDGLKI